MSAAEPQPVSEAETPDSTAVEREVERLRARVAELEGEVGAEVERLRARVAELEAQLVEVEAWANEAVGEAQARVYWLDRWHVDLNELMRRRGASEFRAVLRAIRAVLRLLRRAKRQLFS